MQQVKKEYCKFEDLPLVLNVCDLEKILKISRVSCYELVKTQGFPRLMVGRRIKIPRSAFEKWLEQTVDNDNNA